MATLGKTSITELTLLTPLAVAQGGTGATTAAGARTNLGLGTAATYSTTTSVTSGSSALVTSGAVYSALSGKSDSGHTHNYLPLSGGTLTGDLTFNEGQLGIYVGSNGILGGLNSSNTWTGVSGFASTTVGSASTPTVLRSKGSDLQHYNATTGVRSIIADAENTSYTATTTSSTSGAYAIGTLNIAGESFTLYGKDTNSSTDTKVTNVPATTTKAYLTGTTNASTSTGTQVFDGGVYLTTTPGQLSVTSLNINSTAEVSHIGFSRVNHNYIGTPAGGSVVITPGLGISPSVGYQFNYTAFFPGVNNTYSLGTSSLKWSNVYATTFTGNLTGNVTGNASTATSATTASKLSTVSKGSATQPVYWTSGGIPAACTYKLEKDVLSTAQLTDTLPEFMYHGEFTDRSTWDITTDLRTYVINTVSSSALTIQIEINSKADHYMLVKASVTTTITFGCSDILIASARTFKLSAGECIEFSIIKFNTSTVVLTASEVLTQQD